MAVVKRRTFGVKRYDLRTELISAFPGMPPSEVSVLVLLSHILGDLSVTYSRHTVFIVNGRIIK